MTKGKKRLSKHAESVRHSFGRVFREHRLRLQLSQEAVAKKCQFDRTTPSLYELGLRQPTLDSLLMIADVFQIKAGALVEQVKAEMKAAAQRSLGKDS